MFKLKYHAQFIFFIWMSCIFLACIGDNNKSEELEKAFKLHLESLEIRKTIDEKLSELTTKTDTTFINKNQVQLDSIQADLKTWDELFIEVPGFEHNHEGHDHHHHHENELQITETEHLEIQQYLLTEIKRILENTNKLEKN